MDEMMQDPRFEEALSRLRADHRQVEAPATLRAGVWRRIEAAKADRPRNRFERVLAGLLAPSHHAAAITAACALGLVASTAVIGPADAPSPKTFAVFSAHYPLLPAALLRD